MTIADRLIEEGVQRGIQQGIHLGREEGIQQGERRLKTALTMLSDGSDIASVCKATGLPESEVKWLQELYYKRH